MADWTANSDFGTLNATREPIFRSTRAATGLRAEPRAPRPAEEAPASPGVAALAEYNAGHNGPLAKARFAVWAGGGALSLALMAGLGVWGYKLVLREVLGLPVVAAEEGPMRVLPADPQGEVVPSQGLAVNAIPGAGTAAPPSDVLVLAPQAPGLAEEDLMVVQTRAEAGEVVPAAVVSAVAADPLALVEAGTQPPTAPALVEAAPLAATPVLAAPTPAAAPQIAAATVAPAAPTSAAEAARALAALLPADRAMTAEEILAFADQISAGAPPLVPEAGAAAPAQPTPMSALAAAPLSAALAEATAIAVPAPAAAPVITLAPAAPAAAASLAVRPMTRPATLGTAPPAAPAVAAAPVIAAAPVPASAAPIPASAEAAPAAALTSAIPSGTNLVQLGAFDSAEIAAAEWDRLQTRFGDFLGSKERVIQEAQSEGRTFFRLRALGFADRADARRLCAALTAEGAACIPVTVD